MYIFVSDTTMVTIIAAINKINLSDLSDNNNYVPIAHATVASNLFELLILTGATIIYYMCQSILIQKA